MSAAAEKFCWTAFRLVDVYRLADGGWAKLKDITDVLIGEV